MVNNGDKQMNQQPERGTDDPSSSGAADKDSTEELSFSVPATPKVNTSVVNTSGLKTSISQANSKTNSKTNTSDVNPTPNKSELPDEFGGQKGLEPTRYGDWEKNGRCTDF